MALGCLRPIVPCSQHRQCICYLMEQHSLYSWKGVGEGFRDYLAGAPASGGMGKTLLLGSFFGGWYLFNIYFNL